MPVKFAKAALLLTAHQVRSARANGAAKLACISPTDFLRLTTSSDDRAGVIRGEAAPLDVYNRLARLGRIEAPMLEVSVDPSMRGKIVSHEGRHRAAALEQAGGACMPVMVFPSKNYRVARGSSAPGKACSQYRDSADCVPLRAVSPTRVPRPKR